ncbi:MAG: phenylacetate--CoA ligase family protein [Candidatus Saccharibacteria bacterium]|nr:MAG: phenylacetate--CoA ligase family protein [Candidatus Saccharibacteria bacterium]
MKKDDFAAKKTLDLFHRAARDIPAYKDFLQKHDVQPETIRTIEDFKARVPITDKSNYITQYPFHMLCWNGDLFSNQIIASSSGTMGQSYLWPRGVTQDNEGIDAHEVIYRDIFNTDKLKTLVVVCFSMGEWVAGLFTATATMGVAGRGYKINVVTPGLERPAAIKSIKALGHYYDQIIIAGYPPFLKDVLDEGTKSGINWSKLNIKLLMAGEGISEEWRNYTLKEVHAHNPYADAINIYGCADATMLGYETPASILIRRLYNRRPRLRQDVFGTSNLSSLVQYHPERRYFEAVDGQLIVTAETGIPLIRYDTQDRGGIYTFDELVQPIQGRFNDMSHHIEPGLDNWKKLPFIYLQGRPSSVTTIYSVNVYAENVKAALLDKQIRRLVTGRFTMDTKYLPNMDQYFVLNVELAEGAVIKQADRKLFQEIVIKKIRRLNAEYNFLYKSIGKKAEPKIEFIEWGNTEYFARGVKHKWVKKG